MKINDFSVLAQLNKYQINNKHTFLTNKHINDLPAKYFSTLCNLSKQTHTSQVNE